MTLGAYFTGIANTVRAKSGETGKIRAVDIPSRVRGLILNTDVKSADGSFTVDAYDDRTGRNVGYFGGGVKSVKVDNSGKVVITMSVRIQADGQGSKTGTIDIPIEY